VTDSPEHDEALVSAAQAGDQASFRILVERHAQRVFRVCFRITRDEHLAEDAVQEAFIQAHRKLSSFAGRAQFTTWLHRIAVNAALQQVRKRVQHREADSGPKSRARLDATTDGSPGPERQAEGGLIRQRLTAALNELSDLERAAFSLRHFEDMSIADICTALRIDNGPCKQAIFRAVRKMRTALADFGGSHAHLE
jgi:RNA polymerase sigma-70 factor (ECF subfamily)